MGMRFFGAAVQRLEDPNPVTGQGRSMNDVEVAGVRHAAFVRSPHAPARILAVEDALAPPGVRINEHPVSPARVRELIEAARG